MHQRRRQRVLVPRLLLTTALCASALLLSGCLTGDGVAADFRHEFGGDPSIAEMELTSADNMPFTGGVGGTVTMEDGLSDAQLRDLADRIAAFSREQVTDDGTPVVRIDLHADGWSLPVLSAQAPLRSIVDLIVEQRTKDPARTGSFLSENYDDDLTHVTLNIPDGTTAFTVFHDTSADIAEIESAATLTVRADAKASNPVTLSGRAGPWLDAAQRTYDALRASMPLSVFEAEEESITVTVTYEDDAAEAGEIARNALAPDTPGLFVQSDLVTLFPGAHGGPVRVLLPLMDGSLRDRIVSIWTDDASASFRMSAPSDLDEISAFLANTAEGHLETVTLSAGPPDEPTLQLSAAPADIASRTRDALALLAQAGVQSLRVAPGFSIDLGLSAPFSAEEAAAYAPAVKSLSSEGERLCVRDEAEEGFCVHTAPHIDPSALHANASREGGPFIDAWNAAE